MNLKVYKFAAIVDGACDAATLKLQLMSLEQPQTPLLSCDLPLRLQSKTMAKNGYVVKVKAQGSRAQVWHLHTLDSSVAVEEPSAKLKKREAGQTKPVVAFQADLFEEEAEKLDIVMQDEDQQPLGDMFSAWFKAGEKDNVFLLPEDIHRSMERGTGHRKG